MFNERVLSPEYLALSVEDLEAKHTEFAAGAKALLPAVIEKERLETEAWYVEEMLAIRHIEAGTATPSEVKNIIRAGSIPAVHDAVGIWLSQVSTSEKLSVIGLEDWSWGSSDYLLVPFRVDLDNGVDDALVESVEKVLAFLLPVFSDSAGIPMRVNDERIYLTTRSSRESGEICATVSDYYYSVDYDKNILSIRAALEQAAERLPVVREKRIKEWAEEDRRIAKSEEAKRKRTGILGIFSRWCCLTAGSCAPGLREGVPRRALKRSMATIYAFWLWRTPVYGRWGWTGGVSALLPPPRNCSSLCRQRSGWSR